MALARPTDSWDAPGTAGRSSRVVIILAGACAVIAVLLQSQLGGDPEPSPPAPPNDITIEPDAEATPDGDVSQLNEPPTPEESTGSDDVPSERVAVGEWQTMSRAPIEPRAEPVAVWTGEHVILWGGHCDRCSDEVARLGGLRPHVDDGALYDPVKDIWRPMPAPPVRPSPGANGVWAGSFLLLLSDEVVLAYHPDEDRWEERSDPPDGTWNWSAHEWTGSRLVVLGARDDHDEDEAQFAAAAYDPGADVWRTLAGPPIDTTSPNSLLTSIGGTAIAYGPYERRHAFTIYQPQADKWTSPERAPAEEQTLGHLRAIAADEDLGQVVVGGARQREEWAPVIGAWSQDRGWLSVGLSKPDSRIAETVELHRGGTIVWLPEPPGAGLVLTQDGWRRIAPWPARGFHNASSVWTGEELVVWGDGSRDASGSTAGGVWRPGNDLPLAPPQALVHPVHWNES